MAMAMATTKMAARGERRRWTWWWWGWCKEGPMDGAGGRPTGLRRTGKSCRLRWVNYLHPGLKRGRMTPDEERLVLELYAKWGSRWSRIARRLPGRTDNEIKNYWRTHMRKKAQEEKRAATAATASPSSSTTSYNSPSSSNGGTSSSTVTVARESVGEEDEEAATAASQQQPQPQEYTMDELWDELAAAEAASWGTNETDVVPSSPEWEFCSDSL